MKNQTRQKQIYLYGSIAASVLLAAAVLIAVLTINNDDNKSNNPSLNGVTRNSPARTSVEGSLESDHGNSAEESKGSESKKIPLPMDFRTLQQNSNPEENAASHTAEGSAPKPVGDISSQTTEKFANGAVKTIEPKRFPELGPSIDNSKVNSQETIKKIEMPQTPTNPAALFCSLKAKFLKDLKPAFYKTPNEIELGSRFQELLAAFKSIPSGFKDEEQPVITDASAFQLFVKAYFESFVEEIIGEYDKLLVESCKNDEVKYKFLFESWLAWIKWLKIDLTRRTKPDWIAFDNFTKGSQWCLSNFPIKTDLKNQLTVPKLKEMPTEKLAELLDEAQRASKVTLLTPKEKFAIERNRALISLVQITKTALASDSLAQEWMNTNFKVRDCPKFEELVKKHYESADKSIIKKSLAEASEMHKSQAQYLEEIREYKESEKHITQALISRVLSDNISTSKLSRDEFLTLYSYFNIICKRYETKTTTDVSFGSDGHRVNFLPLIRSYVERLREICVQVIKAREPHKCFLAQVDALGFTEDDVRVTFQAGQNPLPIK